MNAIIGSGLFLMFCGALIVYGVVAGGARLNERADREREPWQLPSLDRERVRELLHEWTAPTVEPGEGSHGVVQRFGRLYW